MENLTKDTNLLDSQPTFIETGDDAKFWHNTLIQTRDSILRKRNTKVLKQSKQSDNEIDQKDTEGSLKIVDESYFSRLYKPTKKEDRNLIDEVCTSFTLNEEQSRAFQIVANHATLKNPTQLKMYLGGMAGTGKSQVIKALIQFFKSRNEEYRFTCIAPTGAAASLIGGSTYHSFLGMNTFNKEAEDRLSNLSEVKSHLRDVDYIFLDEVSMLDCRSLYSICKKMC
ncbi:P-loop containing nucleoside triphosphate hydrolase protein, partial [Irpex lacteus]